MPYLGWIIAVVVLGMLVYPFLQLIPNDKQKRQVAFRQAALKHGIKVSVRTPELPTGLQIEYHALTYCAAYYQHAETVLTDITIALRSNSNKEEWFWINDKRPPASLVPALLAAYKELPAFCLAVEQSPIGSTLFFRDDRDTTETTLIHSSLDKLNAVVKR